MYQLPVPWRKVQILQEAYPGTGFYSGAVRRAGVYRLWNLFWLWQSWNLIHEWHSDFCVFGDPYGDRADRLGHTDHI